MQNIIKKNTPFILIFIVVFLATCTMVGLHLKVTRLSNELKILQADLIECYNLR
jgi:hypothetical protein